MNIRQFFNPFMHSLRGSRFACAVARVARQSSQTEISLLRLECAEIWSSQTYSLPFTVTVLRGNVWLTREGDFRDLLLSAGESSQVIANGKVVIRAMEASLLHIATAAESCFTRNQTN